MLSRRCRIQARPNLNPGSSTAKRSKEPSVVSEAPSTSLVSPGGLTASLVPAKAADSISSENQSRDKEVPGEHQPVADESAANVSLAVSAERSTSPVSLNENIAVDKELSLNFDTRSDVKPVHLLAEPSRNENVGTDRSAGLDDSRLKSPLKNPEKKFTGEEPLDPKKMTMHDLISWNPKNETVMKGRKREKMSSISGRTSEAMSEENGPLKAEIAAASLPAPKVRIADDGTLILDETSLTVAQDKSINIWETVDEDRVVRKISSMSFRKSALRKGSAWSELETELFYLILRATGPDFGLMHEFFPSRSRSELKNKFNKEERSNWDRLKHSLSTPTMLDDSLYDQANEVLEKIKDEAVKKKEVQMTKKNKKGSAASIDWNEDEADLVAEAEEEILRIQEQDGSGEDEELARKRPRRATKRSPKNMKEKIIEETSEEAKKIVLERRRRKYGAEVGKLYKPPIGGLSAEFPQFELMFDLNASAASIELNEEGMPVVKVPEGTVVQALPADDSQPERVLFECEQDGDLPLRRYIIKHQPGPGQPSSGFLHLFGSV